MIPMMARDLSKKIARDMVEKYENGAIEVDKAVAALNPSQKVEVERRYQLKQKSLATAYLFCLMGGLHFSQLGSGIVESPLVPHSSSVLVYVGANWVF